MCGIAGIYNLNNEPVSAELLKRMINIMRHRGPDDEGFVLLHALSKEKGAISIEFRSTDEVRADSRKLSDCNIGLGHCRLAIIDLSKAGHQPMCNENGTIWITYNGEIYNYLELVQNLKAKGHIFKSKTDTEVIIHAYEEWGVNCVQRFNGMWAFVIWDDREKRLFCARDRMGIKPFYYYFDKERFLFASEIKALLQDENVERQPNSGVIFDYLTYGYVEHSDETFFAGIKQLPPAHYLIIDNGNIKIDRYWDLDPAQCFDNITDKEAAIRFYEIFEDSVRLRLQSDVPIGTSLSGGIDSSSVVCVINHLLSKGHAPNQAVIGKRQKTFSSCFEDERFDERRFIQEVVSQTRVDDHYVFPQGKELFAEFSPFVWHQDEPVAGTSQYAQWCVMRLARENGITVLLDGQGGDEALGGYHLFFSSHLMDLARQMRIFKFWREDRKFRRIHAYPLDRQVRLLELLRPFVPDAILTRRKTKRELIELSKLDWLSDDFLTTNNREVRFRNRYSGHLTQHLYRFLTQERLPSLLRYEDRNSMAFSIEARLPFLDYRLIEFIFALPNPQKIRDGMTKVVLRNAMKGILPEKIRQRVDKMGFVTPEATWFRTTCKNQISEIIHSNSFKNRGYFNTQKVQEHFSRFCTESEHDSTLFWRCINLELWMRTFFY